MIFVPKKECFCIQMFIDVYINKYYMDSVVVSVRIKRETKESLEREGIDVEKTVKDFLIQRAAQIKLRKTVERLARSIKRNVKPSKRGFAVKSVREDRDAAS